MFFALRLSHARQKAFHISEHFPQSRLLFFPRSQIQAAQKIAVLGLSVRQAETLCKNMAKAAEKEDDPKVKPLEVDYVAECEKTLSRYLNRGVKITRGKRKGKFELEFYGDDDLQRLYEALQTLKF